MNFRDWLIIIGLIIIVGLIVDAVRRLWFQRRLKSEITFGLQTVKGAEDSYCSELPNGGARLKSDQAVDAAVGPGTADPSEPYISQSCKNAGLKERIAPVFSKQTVSQETGDTGDRAQKETQHNVNSELSSHTHISNDISSSQEHVSLHKKIEVNQVAEVSSLQLAPASEPIVPVEACASYNDAVMATQTMASKSVVHGGSEQVSVTRSIKENVHHEGEPIYEGRKVYGAAETFKESNAKVLDKKVPDENMANPPSSETFFSETLVEEEKEASESIPPYTNDNKNERGEGVLPLLHQEPKEMLVIHLEAKKGQIFAGDQVLQVLLDNGLRLGDMNVFHCIRSGQQRERDVLFSVANGLEPGTFDLKTMRNEAFLVLTFFMPLPGPEQPIEAFKTMVDSIDVVSRHLYAEVKDDQHCQMTLQMLEYYRQKASDYQRLQMLDHPAQ